MIDPNSDSEIAAAGTAPPVVVIGASAGGLEALIEMLGAVEPGASSAFVVVQHLAADQKSILDELLQAHCALPVAQIVADERIEAGRVYIVPPGHLAAIDADRLRLTDRGAGADRFRPIDHCFESLAVSHGRDAYCVVLSGTGSDGAMGLRAIKQSGGITFAQASDSARFPGMPDAAVATGLVDFVLPATEIALRIKAIVYHRRTIGDESLLETLRTAIDGALPRIAKALARATGHDFSDYKPGTMVRRIERRMGLMRMVDIDAFVSAIENDDEEARRLGQDFLIGVTRFFRDPDAFEVLRREVVGPILDREAADIRVWVPGCSTGEEVYSLAILFEEEMTTRSDRRNLQIFGTDIDVHALVAARGGAFSQTALSDVSPERLKRFFTRDGDHWQAHARLRQACVFAPHNVAQDPPFSRIDLVSCRNLLIYLSSGLQRRVLPRFHFSLRPGSFMFLGPSEGLAGGDELFDAIDKKARIFRRRDDVNAGYSSLGDEVPWIGRKPSPRPAAQPVDVNLNAQPSREAMAERAFLRDHAAPFAVVSRGGELRYLSQGMANYARPTSGVPSSHIDALLGLELRVPLRTALEDVADAGEPRTVSGIFVTDPRHDPRMYDLSVSPIRGSGDEFLVVLSEVRATDTADLGAAVGERETADLRTLEAENLRLRRQLQGTLQEFETSDQELKTTNEELMSMNEELQSSNEELETSREELQSINEELETVNAELRENNRQVLRANSDLKNLFESTDVAVLFLDRSFGVRSFTPATAELYGIKLRDVGRPITDLSSRIDYAEFREDAARVDATLETVEREVSIAASGETFLLRMKPYRTTDDRIDGYVLSFFDITTRKTTEEALERQRRDLAEQYAELENLYDTTPVGLSLMDRDLRWVRINERLADINGFPIEAHIGKSFQDLLPDLADNLEATYRRIFETGQPSLSNAIETDFPTHPRVVRSFLADFYPVYVDDEVRAVGACVVEVTEQKRLMRQLAESEARMKRLFDAAPVLILLTEGPDHVVTYSNPANDAVLGNRDMIGKPMIEAIPELEGQGVIERFDAVYGDGRPQNIAEFAAALDRHGDGEIEDGWFTQALEPVFDADRKVTGCVSFAYDITELVEARLAAQKDEAQKTLLLAELQHRVKNTLATIRAISRLLLAGADDAETFHRRLSDRLGAMARTHDLLTDADWGPTGLADLIRAEAAPYERAPRTRVRATGVPVQLTARQTLAFGLAFHEMMTNAAKYGALSNEEGRIEISTRIEGDRRRITWTEIGGPPVRDPGKDRGFGSVVIERVLAADAGADITLEFRPTGLHFEAVFQYVEVEEALP